MDGLARLKAESQRFKEELNSIRTRQLEPDEVSETSAWDSPHTLGKLVSDLQKSAEGNPNVIHSSSSLSGAPIAVPSIFPNTNSTLPVTREYSVYTPDSARETERSVSVRILPVSNSDNSQIIQRNNVQDQDEKDATRITATALFTGNGGKLVLSAPRNFAGESGKSTPLPEPENGKLSSEMYRLMQSGESVSASGHRHDSMSINGSTSGTGIGWKNTTTVSFGNNLASFSTESVISGQNPGVEGLRECIKNRLNGEASGISAHGPSSSPCFDGRINPESGKDSILAKRMASRIKHILQSIGFGKDSPVKERDMKNIIGSCKESTIKNWDIRNMISSCQAARNAYSKGLLDAVCCPEKSSGDNVTKQKPPATCIPDPELYLENVVSALQPKRSCDDLSDESPTEPIAEPYASDITLLQELPTPRTTQGTQVVSDVDCGTQTLARDIDVKTQEPSEKMPCKQMITDAGIQTDPIPCITSRPLPSQTCKDSLGDLVQNNSLSTDQLMIAEATCKSLNEKKAVQHTPVVKRHASTRMSRQEPNCPPTQITGPSSIAAHNPCSNLNNKKKKSVQLTNESIVGLTDNGDLTVRHISSQKSVLDFPVEAAVQAASELTKNLADGVTTKVVSHKAQKLDDCQHERTKSAAKAVQALVGEDFDYGSMYQDLKMLQMERRKLEIRAKTTIELQLEPKDRQTTNKKDCSSKDLILRRKSEVKEASSSVKRQRTTKEPSIGSSFATKPPKPFKWKDSPLHNRRNVPFLASSLDISVDGNMNVGICQNVTAHILKKLVDCRKAQKKKTQHRVNAPLESKQKKLPAAPPAWVERMTKGRPSHEFNEFQKRDSSGGIQSKNLVTRKSVRPPGTIFKSSNPITWDVDCNQVKNLNMNATIVNTNCPGTSNTKHTNKIKNVNVTGANPSPRDDICAEIEPYNAGDLIENVSEGFAAITENLDLDMSFIEQQQEIAWIQEECSEPCETTTLNAPQSGRKGYLESLLNNVLHNIPEEPVENTETVGNVLSVYNMDPLDTELDISHEPRSPKDDDDYKRLLANEVGRDALLAITLQTILNDQSDCDSNDDDREEDVSHQITAQSLLVVNNMEDDERKQDSKCVQTMENTPRPSGQVMFPSLQFIPACYGPDGNNLATPSLCYVPCPPGSYLRCPCEKTPSSTSESDPCRKAHRRPSRNCKDVKQRRGNKKMQKKCYDSSSSLDTPSSPASIHEIEDICQTGFDYNNQIPSSNFVPRQMSSYVSASSKTSSNQTPRDASSAHEAVHPQEPVYVSTSIQTTPREVSFACEASPPKVPMHVSTSIQTTPRDFSFASIQTTPRDVSFASMQTAPRDVSFASIQTTPRDVGFASIQTTPRDVSFASMQTAPRDVSFASMQTAPRDVSFASIQTAPRDFSFASIQTSPRDVSFASIQTAPRDVSFASIQTTPRDVSFASVQTTPRDISFACETGHPQAPVYVSTSIQTTPRDASFVSREAGVPQLPMYVPASRHSTPKETTPSTSKHTTPKEITPSTSRHTTPKETTPSTSRHSTPKQTTPSTSRYSTPKQTTPSTSRHSTPKETTPSASRHSTPKQTTPSTSRHSTPKQTTPSTSRHSTPKQTTPSTSGQTSPRGADIASELGPTQVAVYVSTSGHSTPKQTSPRGDDIASESGPTQVAVYVSTSGHSTPNQTTPRAGNIASEAGPTQVAVSVSTSTKSTPKETTPRQPETNLVANKDNDVALPAPSKIDWEPELLQVVRVEPPVPTRASQLRVFGGEKMYTTGQQTVGDMKNGQLIPSYWGGVGRPRRSIKKYEMDVPSWYEIKKPMKISSSSENLLTSSSDFSSVSSASLGELQQKAFAILRESIPVPTARMEEVVETFKGKPDTSVNLGDSSASDGEIATLKNPRKSHGMIALEAMDSNPDDSVELGEMFFPNRGSQSFSQGEVSSQGELTLREEDGELILNEEDGELVLNEEDGQLILNEEAGEIK